MPYINSYYSIKILRLAKNQLQVLVGRSVGSGVGLRRSARARVCGLAANRRETRAAKP
jgi:hypothetical protein